MPIMNFERRPLFVTIFAAALSSLCFGISIVAIGAVWLNIWQQPPLPTIPVRRKSDTSRRRSAPAALESSTQAKPASIIAPSRNSPSESTPRRVYFVDSGVSQQRNSLPHSHRFSEPSPQASPHSSSSTLVSSTPPLPPSPPLDTREESAVDSDNSSSRKSYRPAFKLPRLMTKTHRRALSIAEGYASQSDDPSAVYTPITRSSTGLSFQKNWKMPRTRRTSIDSVQDGPSRPSSSRMSFHIPGSRVSSTPVPSSIEDSPTAKTRSIPNKGPVARTHPYEYPYFASPPITSRERQHEDSDPERTPTPEDHETQRRFRERKQTNAQAQASLGWGRPVQKRRATSEGCIKD